ATGARDGAYDFYPAARGWLAADNPVLGARVTLEDARVHVVPFDRTWELAVHVERYGCRAEDAELADVPPAGVVDTPHAAAHRRTTRQQTLVEWYVNGPLGIEQGFTLDAPPCADADVALELRVGGLMPTLEPSKDAIALRDDRGVVRGHYTDVFAR